MITEVRTYEEGSTVELQRFLSRLYLDFLSVDFILLVLTSDDDAAATVLLILQILLDEADVIAGLTRLLSTSDLLSLRRVDSVEAVDDLVEALDESDAGVYLRGVLALLLCLRLSLYGLAEEVRSSVGATIESIQEKNLIKVREVAPRDIRYRYL